MFDGAPTLDFACAEQRLLMQFWRDRSGAFLFPCWMDADLADLDRWRGDLSVIDWEGSGDGYRYRINAPNVVRLTGIDMTGQPLSRWEEPIRTQALRMCHAVRLLRSPLLVKQRPSLADSRFWVYRLLLPVAGGGGQVDRILSHAFYSKEPCDSDRIHYHMFGFRPEALRLMDLV